jgi:ferredoxin
MSERITGSPATPPPHGPQSVVLELAALAQLLQALRERGYELVGPTVRDSVVVHDELRGVEDLPAGWTDEQNGGKYRLTRREDNALFGHSVGPQSWRQYLFPPVTRLWRAERVGSGDFRILGQDEEEVPRYAFIGARSCDIHAIEIQDRVFLQGPHADPEYQRRRDGVFILAVNCGQAGGACFCVSQNTGPKATFGFDVALTEVLGGGRHHFVAEVGTERGRELLASLEHRPAAAAELEEADAVVRRTAASMGRVLDNGGIKELLYANYEHARWDEVAARCLTCGNCTLVCPTCFCSSVEDTGDVTGEHAERWRKWDSCFTLDHSYIHGGSVRASPRSRYRQWMTHKLATWIDQFDTTGCVGCGRCVTWCPVGIDITEEAAAIRATDMRKGGETDDDGR